MTHPKHALHLASENTALVLIDFQERLAAAMPEKVRERAVHHTRILLAASRTLGLPVVVTEQYAKGLGPTMKELRDELGDRYDPIDKLEFDCSQAEGFQERLRATGRHEVILVGMEAHICVLQTAVGLLRAGYRVWVAQDAICSRAKHNWNAALRLLENEGAVVAPTETLLFLTMRRAGSPSFKAIIELIR